MPIIGPLWGEFIGYRWIPLTKGQLWGTRFRVITYSCAKVYMRQLIHRFTNYYHVVIELSTNIMWSAYWSIDHGFVYHVDYMRQSTYGYHIQTQKNTSPLPANKVWHCNINDIITERLSTAILPWGILYCFQTVWLSKYNMKWKIKK